MTNNGTMNGTLLKSARGYVERGLAVVPVPGGQKEPRIRGWQNLRLAADDLPAYFTAESNIGIILGSASGGLVDVDLDCDEARALAPRFLPPTGLVTGRPSNPRSHWWYIADVPATRRFRDPETKEMVVELRSTGTQTLVGPSVHPSGEPYDMLEGTPAKVSAEMLAACVKAMYDEVVKRRYGRAEPKRGGGARPNLSADAAPGTVLKRAERYLASIPHAVSGQGGHPVTYWAAVALVHGFALDPDIAFDLLWNRYNPRCVPPWSEKDLRHKVDDAATKPHNRPRGWLLDRKPAKQRKALVRGCTDLANAERFADLFGDRLRYCHATGQWLAWDGKRWKVDDGGAAVHYAGLTARAILKEAASDDEKSSRKDLADWSLKSENRARIDAMVHLAKSVPSMVVRPEDLDADPWLLNVRNGTIDLRTGGLLPHRREDGITMMAPADYDQQAECLRFEAFLGRAMDGDADLMDFVQRLLGMCLTGDVSEQILAIFFGPGANGKSVLLDTVCELMGDYATSAPPGLLVASKHQEHPTEIADLRGRRLVVASETEQGATLRLQLVKRLTGDKRLKGRFMRQDYFEFDRTHKTILVTNNRPVIRENTESVWRRVRLVPFSVVIPEAERNPHLLDELRQEWPGILAWLVRGCLAWQESGLQPPDGVVAATRAYRADEDHVGRFIAECCTVEQPGAFTPWTDLWAAYTRWAEQNGEESLRTKALANALEQRGFRSVPKRLGERTTKGRSGLALVAPSPSGAH